MKRLSVIIPVYNDAARLRVTLEQLRYIRCVESLDMEIIVSVRPSLDNSAVVAQQLADRVVVGGTTSRGRNAGAAVARGEVLLFLDADTVPAVGTFSAILAHAITPQTLGTCTLQTPAQSGIKVKITVMAINFLRWSGLIKGLSNLLFCHRAIFHSAGVRYDEGLLLGEHYDFIRRARQEAGAHFFYVRSQTGYALNTDRYERWGYARSLLFWLEWSVRSVLLQRSVTRLEQQYWTKTYPPLNMALPQWKTVGRSIGASAGMLFGGSISLSAYIGPQQVIAKLFAEELHEDPWAPLVKLLLQLTAHIHVETLLVGGTTLCLISLTILLANIKRWTAAWR